MSSPSRIRQEILKNVRRIVVKVGSSILTGPDGRLARSGITQLVCEIAAARAKGLEVILVSSGAVSAGLGQLGWKKRPKEMQRLQAAAAVGQCVLMQEYVQAFAKAGFVCAQVLLTNEDLRSRARYLNIRNTCMTLLQDGVVPVVNENDTVGTAEIRFGDNDRLSALVTQLLDADLLVLLSDVDGMLKTDASGERTRLSLVEAVDPELESHVWPGGASAIGTGGMKSKLLAARMVTRAGEVVVIAHGGMPGVLLKILAGENVGTLFLPKSSKMAGKKRWIAHFACPRGMLWVDDGAMHALLDGKKSLLATGVIRIGGDFRAGDSIGICGADGQEFARGIVGYSSGELQKIQGLQSKEIAALLGTKAPAEVVHRDNLVLW